jgi:hypothetical protein
LLGNRWAFVLAFAHHCEKEGIEIRKPKQGKRQ